MNFRIVIIYVIAFLVSNAVAEHGRNFLRSLWNRE